ncbi:MAG TPA: hypothetical protein VE865_01875 [Bradyrhizobium sp.]|nr:hypothetical protein [Bradyrhizobium sp.]
MDTKAFFAIAACAAVLAGTPATADQYRPDEFLSLDLSKAVFSPKPLGPEARFEPLPVQAKTDTQARAIKTEPVHVDPVPRHAHAIRKAATAVKVVRATEKPRAPARTKVVQRHRNPLDAQASDTRIQVWPCRSGGICNWQSQ